MTGFKAVHLLAAVVALVVGLVIGGLGPRGELRAVEQQLRDLEDRPCNTRTGADIARIFQGKPWEEGLPQPGQGTKRVTLPEGAVIEPTDTDAEEKSGFHFTIGGDGDDTPAPEDLNETMDMARDALELRHAQAMAALREDADPTPEQDAQIEQAFKKMNDDLIGLAGELRDQVATGEEPARRDAMLFAAETLDVLLTAEDDFRDIFDETQLNNMQQESLDPLSYVDPAIIDVLQDLNR